MKYAVIISNMGGPDSLQVVEPYLRNIFLDPDIIDIPLPGFLRKRFAGWLARKRAPESSGIYAKIGGKTPLTDITEKQGRLLEKQLNQQGNDRFNVFPAMRYWHPFFADVWQEVERGAFEQVIILSLYPFYSTTTTGSMEKLIGQWLPGSRFAESDVHIISRFGSHPLFIKAMAGQIRAALDAAPVPVEDVLLSSHSIPMKRIKNGDPYRDEVEQAAQLLKVELPGNIRLHLSYQSKLGPVEWLGPATPDKIDELAAAGVKNLLAYPFGFVADNSETVYEIGMLYGDRAREKGVTHFKRIDALNDSTAFIEAMIEIIQENVETKSGQSNE